MLWKGPFMGCFQFCSSLASLGLARLPALMASECISNCGLGGGGHKVRKINSGKNKHWNWVWEGSRETGKSQSSCWPGKTRAEWTHELPPDKMHLNWNWSVCLFIISANSDCAAWVSLAFSWCAGPNPPMIRGSPPQFHSSLSLLWSVFHVFNFGSNQCFSNGISGPPKRWQAGFVGVGEGTSCHKNGPDYIPLCVCVFVLINYSSCTAE